MRKFCVAVTMAAILAAMVAGCGTEPYDNDTPYWDAPDVYTAWA